MKKTLICLALAGVLTACGGSDNNDSSQTENPPPSSSNKIGVLTDGTIQGANYSINGVIKQTNERGEFEYQEGDEVTFSIGEIVIGKLKAASRITPQELANDEDTRLNLMIFLQSLDKDGNHDNGIEIPSNLTPLSSAKIDFSLPTSEFIEVLETELSKIPELTNPVVVTPEEAQENFRKAIFKDIAGIWSTTTNDDGESSEVILVIDENGHYTLGEAIPQDSDNEGNGLEKGEISLNSLTGDFTASTSIDTNTDWGLADPNQQRTMTLAFDGSQLTIQEKLNPQEGATFNRLENNVNGIIGAWQSATDHLFIFNANNTYFLLDPVGDDQPDEEGSCGDPGIEFGKYQVRDNKLYIDSRDILVDTNGCAGLSETGASSGLTLNIQANTLVLHPQGEGPVSLQRVK